jgi:hypothetical protein
MTPTVPIPMSGASAATPSWILTQEDPSTQKAICISSGLKTVRKEQLRQPSEVLCPGVEFQRFC